MVAGAIWFPTFLELVQHYLFFSDITADIVDTRILIEHLTLVINALSDGLDITTHNMIPAFHPDLNLLK